MLPQFSCRRSLVFCVAGVGEFVAVLLLVVGGLFCVAVLGVFVAGFNFKRVQAVISEQRLVHVGLLLGRSR